MGQSSDDGTIKSQAEIGAQEPSMLLAQASIVIVFVAAIFAQVLSCTDRFGPRRKYPMWTLPLAREDRAIRSYMEDLKVYSNADIEAAFPSPSGSSSDRAFPKPCASEVPVRIEVRVEGLLDRSTIQSPLSHRDCVMFSAAAVPHEGNTPSALSSRCGDFIVSMTDAPWVKVLVQGADVLCFGMKSGLWQSSHKSMEKAPEHLKEFLAANATTQTIDESQRAIDFEETSLAVGTTVTLVGKLCRGPGGQLSLERSSSEVCELPESSPKESCLTPMDGKYDNAPSKDPWTGKILACDDPMYLSCCNFSGKIQVP